MLDSKGFPNDSHFLITKTVTVRWQVIVRQSVLVKRVDSGQVPSRISTSIAKWLWPACQTGVHQGNHLLGVVEIFCEDVKNWNHFPKRFLNSTSILHPLEDLTCPMVLWDGKYVLQNHELTYPKIQRLVRREPYCQCVWLYPFLSSALRKSYMCTCGSEGCSKVTNASWQVELHDNFAMASLEATSCHLFLRDP